MLDEVEKDPSFSSWERISSEFVDAFRSNYGMRYDSCIE